MIKALVFRTGAFLYCGKDTGTVVPVRSYTIEKGNYSEVYLIRKRSRIVEKISYMNRAKAIVQAEKVYHKGYSGRGVTIAILDSGVATSHPDLRNRVIYFADYEGLKTSCYDDNGHGTHVAGIICGNGSMSRGKYSGMAPGVQLVVLKVLDARGNGSTEHVLLALDWIKKHYMQYNIRLLNFSIGYLPTAKLEEQKKLLDAIDELWDLGIMVITAAGNKGPKEQSVTVPGISRKVLTVGACDDTNALPQYLKQGYSGKGPTNCCIIKPEVLAPGTKIISCGFLGKEMSYGYVEKSGTSMATPIVCGAMALAFEKNRELTPAALKLLVYRSCKKEENGSTNAWGIIQVDTLLDLI